MMELVADDVPESTIVDDCLATDSAPVLYMVMTLETHVTVRSGSYVVRSILAASAVAAVVAWGVVVVHSS